MLFTPLSFYSLLAITVDSESSRVATIGISRCLLPSLWGRGKGEGLLVVFCCYYTEKSCHPFRRQLPFRYNECPRS